MKALAISLAFALLGAAPAWANDAATVDKWYGALGKADGAGLEALLAPTAVIKLNDIGTIQNKAEFLASMDEWKSANGSIRHKADGAVHGGLVYKVCYDFPRNDLLTREIFTFDNGLIAQNEQTSLAETCDGF